MRKMARVAFFCLSVIFAVKFTATKVSALEAKKNEEANKQHLVNVTYTPFETSSTESATVDASEEDAEDTKKAEEYTSPVDLTGYINASDDFRGILWIPAIDLVQPVFQSEEADASDWLNQSLNWDGSEYKIEESSNGSICFDSLNGYGSAHPIIYGHNMKNGLMFGSLKQLLSQEVVEENPYLYLYTPEAEYRFIIYSVYVGNTEDQTYIIRNGETSFDIKAAEESSEISSAVELDDSSEYNVISLVTCNGQAHGNGRLFVHAVQVF